jgi:hypothetical protein
VLSWSSTFLLWSEWDVSVITSGLDRKQMEITQWTPSLYLLAYGNLLPILTLKWRAWAHTPFDDLAGARRPLSAYSLLLYRLSRVHLTIIHVKRKTVTFKQFYEQDIRVCGWCPPTRKGGDELSPQIAFENTSKMKKSSTKSYNPRMTMPDRYRYWRGIMQ